jgi:hypothetical protein
MDNLLEEICVRLDQISQKILGIFPNPGTLTEQINWQFPALTGKDLASLASDLALRIRDANIEQLDTIRTDVLSDVPRRLDLLSTHTISQMAGQHMAVSGYIESLALLEKALRPELSMNYIDDPRYLPAKTANRLKSVTRTMDRIEQDHEGLVSRVGKINEAYAAAQALPSTLQELEEAKLSLGETEVKIDGLYKDATKSNGKIEACEVDSEKTLAQIRDYAEQAEKLIKQCEAAYQITTTKGLAGAFDQRANRLNISIVLWVFGLLGALAAGALLGGKRIDTLSVLASTTHPDWGVVLIHVVLSVLSIGGPVWFAWIATKQIGQRFRLAEDYAFKASVAKAFEGYRKEAAQLDPEFSSRLFSSALTRLEEAPLRLVEKEVHGSPWHELMSSEDFKNAIATIPNFQTSLIDIAKRSLSATTAVLNQTSTKALSVITPADKTPV